MCPISMRHARLTSAGWVCVSALFVRAFRACEVRKMADIDRTGGMMVVLFIALAAIKFFG
jgi:hypothetical protein